MNNSNKINNNNVTNEYFIGFYHSFKLNPVAFIPEKPTTMTTTKHKTMLPVTSLITKQNSIT